MVSGKTRVLAILGDPVEHSLSPALHNAAFTALGLDAVYVALRCPADGVGDAMRVLVRAGGGGNVTVPHKEAATRAVTRPSDLVRRLGAANTFWSEAGEIAGENTDVAGLLDALEHLEAPATAWLVSGTGGGARAVVAAAARQGARVAVRSRDPSRRLVFETWIRDQGVGLAEATSCEVLINSTPLGLRPGDHLPVALDEAPSAAVALDMVYAQGETVWVRQMRQAGLRAADGREMLVAQGAAAFRCWFPEEDAPTEVMRAVVGRALR